MAVPLALAAAGTAMNYLGAKRAENASERAFNMEQQRQQMFQQRQDAALAQSEAAAASLRDPRAMGEAVDARKAAFIEALNSRSPEQGLLPGMASAPQVVQEAAAATDAGARGYSEQQAAALANLTGLGDQLERTGITMGRSGQDIFQTGASRRRSAAALDAELRAAANKGSTLRGLGGMFQQIGMQMIGGGMGGGGAAKPVGLPLPARMGGIY